MPCFEVPKMSYSGLKTLGTLVTPNFRHFALPYCPDNSCSYARRFSTFRHDAINCVLYYIDMNRQGRARVTVYFSSDTGVAAGTYCDIFTLAIDDIAPVSMMFQDRHQRVFGQVKLGGAFINTYI